MILSRQVLGIAVRLTVLNAARDTSILGEQYVFSCNIFFLYFINFYYFNSACHRLAAMEAELAKTEPPKNLCKFYQSLLVS